MLPNIYRFSFPSGELIGKDTAIIDPSVDLGYSWNGWATPKEPPETDDQHIAVFIKDEWTIKTNYGSGFIIDSDGFLVRPFKFSVGQDIDSTHILSQYSGNFIKPKWTGTEWADGCDISDAQTIKKFSIDSECSSRINAGYYSEVEQTKDPSGTIQKLLYKSDMTHQINFAYYINTLIPAHNKGLMTDVPCTWKDASIEGPCHAITDSMAMFLYTEMGLHVQWCRTAADDLKAQVNAATTVDEVNAVAFSDEPDLDEKTMALLGITSMNDLEEGNVI